MQVHDSELRTTREVAREINPILEALSRGDVAKIVILNRTGKVAAVMLKPEVYDDLSSNHVDVN